MKRPQDTPPARSVLVLKGADPRGEALCRVFARKGARIAIQYHDEEKSDFEFKKVLRTAARAAESGAVVLPLDVRLSTLGADAPAGTDEARKLIERVVDDFGRLDAVLYPADLHSFRNASGAAEEKEAGAIANLLGAAAPHLRRARPAGHFTILMPADDRRKEKKPPSDKTPAATLPLEDLETDLAELARQCGVDGTRPRLNAVLPPRSAGPRENPPSPEETARFVLQLTDSSDATGRALEVESKKTSL